MRVVICDDHRLLLDLLATALSMEGLTVVATAEDPEEGVTAVALHDPDVLLLDVGFPTGSGLDAARRVIDAHPRTKVVMMTGSDDAALLLEALAVGVWGYLAKDQPVDAIARALEMADMGGRPIDQGLLRRLRPAPAIPAQRAPCDELTPRERHVLRLLEGGMSTREMVAALGVSQSTVRTHVQNIFAKLGVHTRLQAVALASDSAFDGPGGGRVVT